MFVAALVSCRVLVTLPRSNDIVPQHLALKLRGKTFSNHRIGQVNHDEFPCSVYDQNYKNRSTVVAT